MHKSLRRALQLAATAPLVAATLVTGATSAHAVASCPDSTDVVDFDVFVAGSFRVAYRPEAPNTTTVICIQAITDAHVVVLLWSGPSVTPPSVTTTDGSGSCPVTLVDMDDPTDFRLSLSIDPDTGTVCLGHDGTTTTISVGMPAVTNPPGFQVWLPANTFLVKYGACAGPWANYTANPSAENHRIWVSCYNGDRVYPELP